MIFITIVPFTFTNWRADELVLKLRAYKKNSNSYYKNTAGITQP